MKRNLRRYNQTKSYFANKELVIFSNTGNTEQLFRADGAPLTSGDGGFQDDTICCITCSDSYLLIGRDSGTILIFSMQNFKKITSINMNTKPYKLGLNSNSRYDISVICILFSYNKKRGFTSITIIK